jgi:hypothetical protein
MFVRASARSRTHRPREDTRIRKVLPFFLDLRRRKCRRISRTASPARKLHTHRRQKRDGERKRQSWVAKSVVVLVYSARLQIVSLRTQESMMNEKRHETERNAEGMKNGCQRWMQNACNEWMYRELMDERDFSSSVCCDFTTSSSFSGMFRAGMHDEWKKTWQRDDEKRMKKDGRNGGMQNAGIWRRIMNGYIENPWTKVSFIHLLMSLGQVYSARLQQESMMNEKKTWKKDDAIGMKNGGQRGILNERWVRMNESIHRDSMDECVIYSSVVALCGQMRVRERREHHVCFFPSRESWNRSRVARIAHLFVAI